MRRARIVLLLALLLCRPVCAQPPQPPTVESLALEVETLTAKIEYLLELVEQLVGRVTVLEARAIPTECKVTVVGVPVTCKLLK